MNRPIIINTKIKGKKNVEENDNDEENAEKGWTGLRKLKLYLKTLF